MKKDKDYTTCANTSCINPDNGRLCEEDYRLIWSKARAKESGWSPRDNVCKYCRRKRKSLLSRIRDAQRRGVAAPVIPNVSIKVDKKAKKIRRGETMLEKKARGERAELKTQWDEYKNCNWDVKLANDFLRGRLRDSSDKASNTD